MASNTTLATCEAGEPTIGPDAGCHTVWYWWSPEDAGLPQVTVSTFGSDFDTLLMMYGIRVWG